MSATPPEPGQARAGEPRPAAAVRTPVAARHGAGPRRAGWRPFWFAVKNMTMSDDALRELRAFLWRKSGGPPRDLRLELRPLAGGLEATAVRLVYARYRDQHNRRRVSTCVLKVLPAHAAREADVYEGFLAGDARGLAPRLFHVHRRRRHVVLVLESVRRIRSWPWRDTRHAAQVLATLGRLHRPGGAAAAVLPAWDYEAELQARAAATLAALERCRSVPELAPLLRSLPRLRRVVAAVPAIRRQLLAVRPFGATVLHGDAHPGNAVVRRRALGPEPVLIDWGRARTGSPLEDVSSWLRSVGFWEPAARRRHDTLLAGYFSGWGLPHALPPELRAACWLAAGSNALSGALQYHLGCALGAATPSRREAAAHAAHDWLRVIRQVDRVWS